MSELHVQLPEYLRKNVEALAEREGVSTDQFIALAVAEKMSALLTEEYLEERAKRGSREKYEAALEQVPDVEPEASDKIEESDS